MLELELLGDDGELDVGVEVCAKATVAKRTTRIKSEETEKECGSDDG